MGADDDDEDLYIKEMKSKDEEEALREAMEAGKEGRFTAHVKVPTQKDIEEALLRRKKQELLEMLAIDSHDLDQLEREAKLEPKEAEPEKMETNEELVAENVSGKNEEDVEMSEESVTDGGETLPKESDAVKDTEVVASEDMPVSENIPGE